MARLTIWHPFTDMLAFNPTIEQRTHDMYRARSRSADVAYSFPVDLSENQEVYTLQATLPAVHPDNLTIDFSDGLLTIRAASKVAEEQEGTRYHLRERIATSYERSFRFPQAINADAIEATFEHGVLTLFLPKAEEARPRRITVQAVNS